MNKPAAVLLLVCKVDSHITCTLSTVSLDSQRPDFNVDCLFSIKSDDDGGSSHQYNVLLEYYIIGTNDYYSFLLVIVLKSSICITV